MHTTRFGKRPTIATMRCPKSIRQRVHQASISWPAARGRRGMGGESLMAGARGASCCLSARQMDRALFERREARLRPLPIVARTSSMNDEFATELARRRAALAAALGAPEPGDN